MAHLQIEVDTQTENRLKQISEQEGGEIPEVASRLLTRAVNTARPTQEVAEADLLQRINAGWSAERWQRYHELVEKRRSETLTPDEYTELVALTNEREIAHAKRIEYLVELAKLRQTPLETVMKQLGIKAPGYV